MEDLNRFRIRLETIKRRLTETNESVRDSAKPVQLDQARVGRLARMDAMQEQAMAMDTLRRQKEQLRLIDQALNRVASGEYGVCLSCREGIDPRRLEFDPAARLCIACSGRKRTG